MSCIKTRVKGTHRQRHTDDTGRNKETDRERCVRWGSAEKHLQSIGICRLLHRIPFLLVGCKDKFPTRLSNWPGIQSVILQQAESSSDQRLNKTKAEETQSLLIIRRPGLNGNPFESQLSWMPLGLYVNFVRNRNTKWSAESDLSHVCLLWSANWCRSNDFMGGKHFI